MKMNGLHAVMVPFPVQGTINPLINLAHLLSSRGDVWKIGIDLEGVDVDENVVVTREEIEKGVRRLMEGPKARELRKRGMELKEAAFKAVP
ncbi:hypothetical protein SUGI_0089480 [Cryptomeria japonica]|nr:hypothetical protein SUGI_0089480 [Cryptomeria japonica]